MLKRLDRFGLLNQVGQLDWVLFSKFIWIHLSYLFLCVISLELLTRRRIFLNDNLLRSWWRAMQKIFYFFRISLDVRLHLFKRICTAIRFTELFWVIACFVGIKDESLGCLENLVATSTLTWRGLLNALNIKRACALKICRVLVFVVLADMAAWTLTICVRCVLKFFVDDLG